MFSLGEVPWMLGPGSAILAKSLNIKYVNSAPTFARDVSDLFRTNAAISGSLVHLGLEVGEIRQIQWTASSAKLSRVGFMGQHVKVAGLDVKKLTVIIALCCCLTCSPGHAKTFVGVLWPMFGPTAAPGLVELVAELKMMPDVEVSTYLHQSWPSLVEDIDRQAPGTHTVVVGYSLGANSSVFVANKAKYVDLIIALQPSMLSWNPPVTGKVGRIIEIYNPNPWMTFGGMGSKKLVGENIEYITNYDSHPGAQFSSEFRSVVKSEIAKLSSDTQLEPAKAAASQPKQLAQLPQSAGLNPREERRLNRQADLNAKDNVQIARTEMPKGTKPTKPEYVAEDAPKQRQGEVTALLDRLTRSVNSGNLLVQRRLTISDMKDYAERTYHDSHTAESITTASLDAVVGPALTEQQRSDLR
jgi:hypothetical protein